jgi:hypothetical protein
MSCAFILKIMVSVKSLLVGVSIVISLCGNGLAFAQSKDIRVGSDDTGGPIMLDVDSLVNSTYKLYQRYGNDGIFQMTIRYTCSESRLFTERVAIYSGSGKLLSESFPSKEMNPHPESAAAVSMKIACKAIGARGW